ncbi:MAG: helix-turn-helix domain-containing protein [Actinomycetota bacterium]
MELLNAKQAAEKLNISTARVRQLAGQGRLPGAQRVGRDWVIPAEAVEKFEPLPPHRPRKRE